MKPSIQNKLQNLVKRYEELKELLSDPKVTNDLNRYRDLSREFAQIEPNVQLFLQYQDYQRQWEDSKALLEEDDPELQQMAKQEIKVIEEKLGGLEEALLVALVPRDPHDDNNIFLEIRAGTGGDEAAIFAGDLSRMYMRYAETQHFKVEILSESHGEHGGYKEIIMRVIGQGAYSRLKFESGVHRVQRIPATEAQGRIHTSTCTVAVLPEMEEIESIDINPADLRIDTFRASGAGGQHVQKTDSAIRITHIPTGTVVECQDERSQHKNRARAMSLLKSRILSAEREKQQKQQAETRRSLVGTGDRSERIRTYNFPQGRLTDHRINLTLYQLPQIMEGDLSPVIEALSQEYHADLIASLGE
ncbi:Peptide chain release factor 1 [Aquicella siphonis]|uniref:Peptide chain release factor 1 n=1 Tax=Aquicella siphonis TaxID=254247 RepID=A0A5E4PIB7_9COXI|nr:peptide chain release factor 1 [Aquicella siphonis]VVC76694.1 Peptide chain release factor 1 [Aquicella siphonis]